MAKMVEDAFRAIGILKDDTPKYVARTILEVITVPKEKRPKAPDDSGAKARKKSQDWLEVIITPYDQFTNSLNGSHRPTFEEVVPA